MSFIKYMHIEKFGNIEVEGIVDLVEPCTVQPKLDGCNSSLWLNDDGSLGFGSRNRKLSLEKDNQGFMAKFQNDQRFIDFFKQYSHYHLYGEFLVPHSLKDYQDEAWSKFYVFDVYDKEEGEFVQYDDYVPLLENHNIDYIPILAIVHRGTEERFKEIMNNNTYLMKEGCIGEGIVMRKHGFKNKFGRTVWAKMVRSEFKTKHIKEMGPQKFLAKDFVEEKIVEKYCTEALIEKVFANIINIGGGWSSKCVPRLLETVWYDFIREETWNFLKEFNNPTIDFKVLRKFVTHKIKTVKKDIFS